MMEITFLGHAGFCVETERIVVVMDPWLSPAGAFDSAWFQFPRNHHLAALVQEKLADGGKERFLYVSHEHKDHLDLAFLESLRSRDFTVVLAHFRRPYLVDTFSHYRCRDVVVCEDGAELEIPGGDITVYLDDSELNRDSAVLVRAEGQAFLNLNDCRIVDALPMIVRTKGPIDVFAMQFSGAGWHPTCYDYPRDVYERISRKKSLAKFASVAQGIRVVDPRVFIPSAGPPCFLDPSLMHLNFEPVNIFPHASKLVEFLDRRATGGRARWIEMVPGDVLDVPRGELAYRSRLGANGDYEDSIRDYAAGYESLFAERRRRYQAAPGDRVLLDRVGEALQQKLDRLTLNDRVESPLYFMLDDVPDRMLRIDFPARRIERAEAIEGDAYYSIKAPSWEVARILDGKITWDDFSLTFRMELNREPDVYQTLVQGFLRLEPDDMNAFCAKLLSIEEHQERIVVEVDGKRYVVDRYCPHQGGDLSRGWVEEGRFLTCPRHQWQFDLENDGDARRNAGTIHAICLDDD
jgi:UDP-MurNAc hydroxylase